MQASGENLLENLFAVELKSVPICTHNKQPEQIRVRPYLNNKF